MPFSELGLKTSSLRAIEQMGFEKPSDIQSQAIPILMAEKGDFVGQAQTGTGKTAAFVLPLLEKIDPESSKIQAIIIAPTRELANQINEEIKKLAKFEPVKSQTVYGGVPVGAQIREIRKLRPQIVVGTPGRLIDMIERQVLDISACQYAVLDEADEMLDMGFLEDVETILSEIDEKTTWMFSATMPQPIKNLVNKQFQSPQFVKVKNKELTANNIDQFYTVVKPRDQIEALRRYLDYVQDCYAIIFCRTKLQTKELASELNFLGHKADALHGDMVQEQRDLTMENFKSKKIRLLVCTDVAARGIDVNDLTHVINFSLSQDNESYVHRIGRTGRGGKDGMALSIITPDEESRISMIERITKAKIKKAVLPGPQDIRKSILNKAADEFMQDLMIAERVPSDLIDLYEKELSMLTREELIQGIVSGIYTGRLRTYEKARQLDAPVKRAAGGRRGAPAGGTQSGYAKFFINLGQNNGVNPGDIIKIVSRNARIQGSEIGKISLKDKFSFFEVPSNLKSQVESMSTVDFRGMKVRVEASGAAPSRGPKPRSSYGNRRSKERRSYQ